MTDVSKSLVCAALSGENVRIKDFLKCLAGLDTPQVGHATFCDTPEERYQKLRKVCFILFVWSPWTPELLLLLLLRILIVLLLLLKVKKQIIEK